MLMHKKACCTALLHGLPIYKLHAITTHEAAPCSRASTEEVGTIHGGVYPCTRHPRKQQTLGVDGRGRADIVSALFALTARSELRAGVNDVKNQHTLAHIIRHVGLDCRLTCIISSLLRFSLGACSVGDWITVLNAHAAQRAAEPGLNLKLSEKARVTPYDDDDEAQPPVEVTQARAGHD